MLNRILLVLLSFATLWFFAITALAWLVGAVPLCDAMFQPALCAALGVQ
jgi:hypothetical protein